MLQETKNIIPPYKFRKQQIELHTEQSSETLLPTVRSQFHSKTLVGVHEKLSKQNNTEIKRMILYRVGACAEVHQVPEILRLPHALAQRVGAVHLPDLDDALRAELDALRRAPGRPLEHPLQEHGGSHGREARERRAALHGGLDHDLERGGAGAVAGREERERAAGPRGLACMQVCNDAGQQLADNFLILTFFKNYFYK
jgi:hypothetical protein